jgi:hypothetical protein
VVAEGTGAIPTHLAALQAAGFDDASPTQGIGLRPKPWAPISRPVGPIPGFPASSEIAPAGCAAARASFQRSRETFPGNPSNRSRRGLIQGRTGFGTAKAGAFARKGARSVTARSSSGPNGLRHGEGGVL